MARRIMENSIFKNKKKSFNWRFDKQFDLSCQLWRKSMFLEKLIQSLKRIIE